jgi:hypothetical protein
MLKGKLLTIKDENEVARCAMLKGKLFAIKDESEVAGFAQDVR